LTREATQKAVPVLRKYKEGILVEVVEYEVCIPSVGFPSVNKEKRLEESELAYRKI